MDKDFASLDVFTTGQLSKLCGVAPRTASKWADNGQIRHWRVPGSNDRRFSREGVLAFLRQYDLTEHAALLSRTQTTLLIGLEPLTVGRLRDLLPETDERRYALAPSWFDAGLTVERLLPRAIVVDTALGRDSALRFAYRLRGEERHREAFLVALAQEDDGEAPDLLAAGFDTLLRKSFDVELLVTRLRIGRPVVKTLSPSEQRKRERRKAAKAVKHLANGVPA